MIVVVAFFVLLLFIAFAMAVCYQYFCNKCRSCAASCAELRSRLRHSGRGDIDQQLFGDGGTEAAWPDGVLWSAGRTFTDSNLHGYGSLNVAGGWRDRLVVSVLDQRPRGRRFESIAGRAGGRVATVGQLLFAPWAWPYSTPILSGSVNEYRLRLGRLKAGMCDAAWCAPCRPAWGLLGWHCILGAL